MHQPKPQPGDRSRRKNIELRDRARANKPSARQGWRDDVDPVKAAAKLAADIAKWKRGSK